MVDYMDQAMTMAVLELLIHLVMALEIIWMGKSMETVELMEDIQLFTAGPVLLFHSHLM